MSNILTKLINYGRLIRLQQPAGIFLLLWPVLWGLWLAGNGKPSLHLVVIFVAGVVIMRSAGCVINDFADRNFDHAVNRTKNRPLATGKVSSKEAIILFILLLLVAFVLVLKLNFLSILLSFIAVFLTIIYPFMKRFFHAPQLILGLAFNWGVPMAFAAQTGTLPPITWLVFLISVLWTFMYDTEYAMADKEDDLKLNLKSTAILFGHADKIIIGLLQLVILILLGILGWLKMHSWIYYLWLSFGALILIYQQCLISNRQPVLCTKAFLSNQWFGLVVFLGILSISVT